MTDNLSHFEILTKATMKMEKRLMIDYKTFINAYDKMNLQDAAFHVMSEFNIADGLTTIKQNAVLLETFLFNQFDYLVQQ